MARREVAATVGLDTGARFFLAGGAFKSLVTGLPPRDLDLWAPSERDRELLVSALLKRGANAMSPRPFAQAFEINGRVVEVPRKVEPNTLTERLGRFDSRIVRGSSGGSIGWCWSGPKLISAPSPVTRTLPT